MLYRSLRVRGKHGRYGMVRFGLVRSGAVRLVRFGRAGTVRVVLVRRVWVRWGGVWHGMIR